MSMARRITDEKALRVVNAIDALGRPARFEEIERETKTTTSTTAGYIKGAIDRGWVAKTGPNRSINSRYETTTAGLRAARKASDLTVELGSGSDASADVVIDAGEQPQPSSLRERVMRALCDERTFGIVGLAREVRSDASLPFSFPELNATVKSLAREGLATYREGAENGHHALVDIRATRKLLIERGIDTTRREVGHHGTGPRREAPMHAGDRTDFRTHRQRAEGGPIERLRVSVPMLPPAASITIDAVASASVPTVVTIESEWPLLDAIEQRWSEQAEARRHADALIEAATLLADVDRAESERLFARSSEIAASVSVSSLEVEYLRFAQAHGRKEA